MSDYGLISDPSIEDHTGFLIAEEMALKNYLSGVQVPVKHGKSGPGLKNLPVYFRWPTSERHIDYPYATIDLLSITPAYERWHSYFDQYKQPAYYEDAETGEVDERFYRPGYSDDVQPETEGNPLYTQNFLPYNLLFQVSTFCRTATDDRFLISRFLTDYFPHRSFFISTIPDKVWHRCELLEWVSADTMETIEATKRQFRKIYTVLMESEMQASTILEYQKVNNIHVDIYDLTSQQPLPPGHDTDSPAHDDLAGHFNTTA